VIISVEGSLYEFARGVTVPPLTGIPSTPPSQRTRFFPARLLHLPKLFPPGFGFMEKVLGGFPGELEGIPLGSLFDGNWAIFFSYRQPRIFLFEDPSDRG